MEIMAVTEVMRMILIWIKTIIMYIFLQIVWHISTLKVLFETRIRPCHVQYFSLLVVSIVAF